ncbi:MAG: hypothetical protein COT74_04540 [Bdellovibrionales bacterium CG10_big_fil_rev_8_21_14_0_10_45_34]|nr:MAG: hypothetical protein COT74_04540 [Bdellovibrionales bacterium CG10_big_fil_rev_8_21_14_0_10_45_34]
MKFRGSLVDLLLPPIGLVLSISLLVLSAANSQHTVDKKLGRSASRGCGGTERVSKLDKKTCVLKVTSWSKEKLFAHSDFSSRTGTIIVGRIEQNIDNQEVADGWIDLYYEFLKVKKSSSTPKYGLDARSQDEYDQDFALFEELVARVHDKSNALEDSVADRYKRHLTEVRSQLQRLAPAESAGAAFFSSGAQ